MQNDRSSDGVDRRRFLECMAWAGTGLVWAVTGGVLTSRPLEAAAATTDADFSFVQISDSHIGFKGAANPDVLATFQQAITRINALPAPTDLLIHTGDLTHGQKPGAFDTVSEALKAVRTGERFFVPGEHDVFADGGKEFRERFGAGTLGDGWRSFDHRGVHFVGLVNVLAFKSGGAGSLGTAQIEWLEKDLKPLASSTPVVVYTHIPLWAVYPQWGWVTADGEQALAYLRRFGSVTVLNGHIHQVMKKVEGNIRFYTARSSAYPQPAPGSAPSPGPLKVSAGELRGVLGVRHVDYVETSHAIAVVDDSLA
jgi:3',5'-cyclic AMP phosphodiesterase CpdA